MMVSGVFGAFCVLAVNSWMNAPSGFRLDGGKVVDVDPLAAIFNKALPMQFLHMLLAAYMVTGFLVASVYAAGMLRGRRDHRHRLGFLVAFGFASVASVIQPVVGHVAGMRLATQQPEKLAAMDLAVDTKQNAPLTIGGALIDGRARGGIEIPGVGSMLARAGFNRPVRGLNDFAVDDRPPVNIVHWSFQSMVALGTALALGSTGVLVSPAARPRPVFIQVDDAPGDARRTRVGTHVGTRLDHHRSRPAAVDGLPRAACPRRGDRQRRRV